MGTTRWTEKRRSRDPLPQLCYFENFPGIILSKLYFAVGAAKPSYLPA